MARVTILRRESAPDPSDPEGVKLALGVTYFTDTHSPRQIIVPGEKPTEEQIAEAIRQDLAGREGASPTTLEV